MPDPLTYWVREPKPGQSLNAAKTGGVWVRYGNTTAEKESWEQIRRIGVMATAITRTGKPPPD